MKYETKILKQIYDRIIKSMSGLSDINIKIQPSLEPSFIPADQCINMPSVISWAKDDEQDFQFGRGTLIHEAGHVLFAPDLTDLSSTFKQDTFMDWINVFLDCNNENKVVEVFPHLRMSLAQKTEGVFESAPEMLSTDNPFMQVLMRCYEVSDKIKAEYPSGYNEKLKGFIEWTVKKYYGEGIGLASGKEVIIFTKEVDNKFRKLMREDSDLAKRMELMKEKGKMIIDRIDTTDVDEKIRELRGSGGKVRYSDGIDKRILGKIPVISGVYSEDSVKGLKKKIKKECEHDVKLGRVFIGKVDVKQLKTFDLDIESDDVNLTKARNIGKRIKKRLMRKINLASTYGDKHRSGLIDIEEIRRQISDYGMLVKESLFKRDEVITRGGEWAVEVLCDLSCSMCGSRLKHAKQALATLAYGLDGLPNIHYSLIGFSDIPDVTDFIIKGMNKKLDIKKITGLMCQKGNTDGFNIRSSARRLSKMGCKKVMIVISDGSPVYEGGMMVDNTLNPIRDTMRAIYEARANNINVIGIAIEGVNENDHIMLYGKEDRYDFRDNTGDLDKELANVILKAIGNKVRKKFVKKKWRVVE